MSKKFPEIAKRLKSLREKPRKNSRKKLGSELNIHEDRIWRLETGNYELTAIELMAYSKKYKKSPEWILTGKSEEREPDKAIDENLRLARCNIRFKDIEETLRDHRLRLELLEGELKISKEQGEEGGKKSLDLNKGQD